MTANVETLWLRDRKRTLPYWSPAVLQPLADALFAAPALNDAMVAALICSLLLIAAGYAAVWPALRVTNALLFATLSAVDLPRLFRLQQCMFSMSAFALATPARTLMLILGGVYTYSGASKLLMPVFYYDWADGVCAPLKTLCDYLTLTVLPLHNWPRLRRGVFYCAVGAAMAGETVMGLALLDAATFRWASPLWVHLLVGGIGVVALHAYIIVFIIALPRPMEPGILNWNVLCSVVALTVTQLALSPLDAPAIGLSRSANAWTPPLFDFGDWFGNSLWHALVVFAFDVYPVSMYFGRAFAFEFTFSYFNGAMFGAAYGVFRKDTGAAARFPDHSRGRTLRLFIASDARTDGAGAPAGPHAVQPCDAAPQAGADVGVCACHSSNPLHARMRGGWWESGSGAGAVTGLDSYRELLLWWRRHGVSLPTLARQLELPADPAPGDAAGAAAAAAAVAPEESDADSAALTALLRHTFAIDCDWLCTTHSTDIADPYRAASSCYLPSHFYGMLARTAFRDPKTGKPAGPAAYVITGHESWFGAHTQHHRIA